MRLAAIPGLSAAIALLLAACDGAGEQASDATTRQPAVAPSSHVVNLNKDGVTGYRYVLKSELRPGRALSPQIIEMQGVAVAPDRRHETLQTVTTAGMRSRSEAIAIGQRVWSRTGSDQAWLEITSALGTASMNGFFFYWDLFEVETGGLTARGDPVREVIAGTQVLRYSVAIGSLPALRDHLFYLLAELEPAAGRINPADIANTPANVWVLAESRRPYRLELNANWQLGPGPVVVSLSLEISAINDASLSILTPAP